MVSNRRFSSERDRDRFAYRADQVDEVGGARHRGEEDEELPAARLDAEGGADDPRGAFLRGGDAVGGREGLGARVVVAGETGGATELGETLDGVGEWATTVIGRGSDDQIELMSEMRFPHSLGLLYSAFTAYCGFRVNSGEYKLMGLAPFGEPKYAAAIREHLIDVKPDAVPAVRLTATPTVVPA